MEKRLDRQRKKESKKGQELSVGKRAERSIISHNNHLGREYVIRRKKLKLKEKK